jgi:formylglycine-generating enzyme required for sulfatase activity
MEGNVFAWCQENYQAYPSGKKVHDDQEDSLVIDSTVRRVVRGGSFLTLSSNVRSAYRDNFVPTNRDYDNGFRPARTFTP